MVRSVGSTTEGKRYILKDTIHILLFANYPVYVGISSVDGKIQQLSLPDMSLEEVETIPDISKGSSLAAFMDSSGVLKVIYQATDNILHITQGVTVFTNGTVEIVFLYFIGRLGHLQRLKVRGQNWTRPKRVIDDKESKNYQFAVMNGGEEKHNVMYYLDDGLEFGEEVDLYEDM